LTSISLANEAAVGARRDHEAQQQRVRTDKR
jgi:hypothetical protein